MHANIYIYTYIHTYIHTKARANDVPASQPRRWSNATATRRSKFFTVSGAQLLGYDMWLSQASCRGLATSFTYHFNDSFMEDP
jgi:hypothetical protein